MSFIQLAKGAAVAVLTVASLQAVAAVPKRGALPVPPPTPGVPVVTVRPPVIVTPPTPVVTVPTCQRGGPGVTPC